MDHRRLLLCLGLPVALAVQACQTQPESSQERAPSSALEDLDDEPDTPEPNEGPSLAELARQSADDLAALMDMQRGGQRAVGEDPPGAGERRPWQDRMDPSDEPTAPEPPAAEPQARQETEMTPEEAAPPPDPVALLLAHLETLSGDPERAFAAEVLARAVRAFAEADEDGLPGQHLSPTERQLIEELRPLLEAMAAGDRADAPRRIARAIDELSRALPAVLPVRINDAALATDIYGFAAYRPFERYTFLAGRQNRMLLYTEPASFESRPAAEPASRGEAPNPGAYEVVLGLELRLYNERGSMLAWRKPEERVVIRSDRPRSEIYLGTVLELPASLGVGRYQLKVIVRDEADGSEDERVIPIEFVADPRLTSGSTLAR